MEVQSEIALDVADGSLSYWARWTDTHPGLPSRLTAADHVQEATGYLNWNIHQ